MSNKLPCQECGGKCCTPPAMNRRDAQRIEKYTKHKTEGANNFYMLEHSWDEDGQVLMVCPAFDNESKICSIYAFRPTVCRKFAEIKELPCIYLYPEQSKKYAEERVGKLLKRVIED